MTVRLFDSKTQASSAFVPLVDGEVSMYVCGPTVQSAPHIGHLRSALVYDLWRRWFAYRGYRVTLVRNVTDIDDKVLDNASDAEPWWALAYRMELEFTAGYRALGILPPSYEPRATAFIPQMQELIQRLIDRGHAYAAADASGDVYFDTASWPSYGELTRQSLDDMAPATDADPRGKRDPRDFALWKGRKEGEPETASWASPWGAGRPGWHIECSAMSSRFLGPEFDIHGGGLDLRFPHHENELAQSTAAGHGFARHWVHNGLVNVEGQKMSKSLGNSLYAADFLRLAPPIVIRYYLSSAHYRSTIDYHEGALDEAAAAFERIRNFLDRARELLGAMPEAEVPPAFAEALDDDLGVPQALAVLHDTVRAGNQALDARARDALERAAGEVVAMTSVLGVNPLDEAWQDAGAGAETEALSVLVDDLIRNRESARASRDFEAADRIRDLLAAARIRVEDSASGARWSVER